MKLSDTLNKTIADFCKNNFTGTVENHCAYFVCHVLELDAGYDCKTHTNGSHPGSCLRVQELFPECPQVGNWNNAPQGMKIVFVTDKSNVDLIAHTMRNVPKKHVGIFSDGNVYHYSNAQDIVIRQTPTEFLARFQAFYVGDQVFTVGDPRGLAGTFSNGIISNFVKDGEVFYLQFTAPVSPGSSGGPVVDDQVAWSASSTCRSRKHKI